MFLEDVKKHIVSPVVFDSHVLMENVFCTQELVRSPAPQLHLEYTFYKLLAPAGNIGLSGCVCLSG